MLKPNPDLSLVVLHEDDWLVVVQKPAGMHSHALKPEETRTLCNALLAHYPHMQGVGYGPLEPGILHRLDQDTSGAMIACKTQETFIEMQGMLIRGEVHKQYLALVCAHPVHGFPMVPQVIASELMRDPKRSARVIVKRHSAVQDPRKQRRTRLTKIETFGAHALITLEAHFAGRHQIRAHMKSIGYPLVGDMLYKGAMIQGLTRHFLHASSVEFVHPCTRKKLKVEAPMPHELTACLQLISASQD